MKFNKPEKIDLATFENEGGENFTDAQYQKRLAAVQLQLLQIQQAYLTQKQRAVIMFEGTDAAGKGGAIRRLSERLDPRFCKVWPIGAPSEEDRKQHYLTRFFTRLPGPGEIAVFDRSWYGRVLVERVEGLTPKHEWKRGYDEINEFERMLTDAGYALIKLYLVIDRDEQAKRFIERMSDPIKRWKITARDFEARVYFDDYLEAAEDMIAKTARKHAPWYVFQSYHKYHARILALEAIAKILVKKIDLNPPPLDEVIKRAAKKQLGYNAE